MSTRDVSTEDLDAAQVRDAFALVNGEDYLYKRPLGDGRCVFLVPLMTGTRLAIGPCDSLEFDDVWDYPRDPELCEPNADWLAALGWDGEGEPEGWYRHVRSGRRRPGGDPNKEQVRE